MNCAVSSQSGNGKKKRESLTLPVPRIEALALPIKVERANTQKPHAEYETHL